MKRESLRDQVRQLLRYATTGWRRKALIALFILASLGVITQIIIANWDLLVAYDWEIKPSWLVYAVVFFFVDFFVSLWAWHLLVVNLTGFDNLRRTAKIVLTSNLARRIPGSVWYITGRALLYGEQGVSKRSISLLSGLEMIFFMISAVVTFVMAVPFWVLPGRLAGTVEPAWLLAALPVGMVLVHPRLLQRIWHRISRERLTRPLKWRDTVVWLALYVLTWILGAVVLFCVINFFHRLSWGHFMPVLGMWALAGIISITGFFTISIIGLREISLVFLLAQFVPHPITILIAISVRLIWLAGELITALISLKL